MSDVLLENGVVPVREQCRPRVSPEQSRSGHLRLVLPRRKVLKRLLAPQSVNERVARNVSLDALVSLCARGTHAASKN